VDPWKTLGVAPHAPFEVVKSAWRAAARRSHPDRGGCAGRFKAVQAAWDSVQRTYRTGSGAGEASSVPWTHARAVRHFAQFDVDLESFGDGTTGIAGAGGVAWLSDEGLEWDGFVVPWSVLDDGIMDDAVELLLGGMHDQSR